MPNFNNLNDLFSYLQMNINDVLEDELAEEVKDVMTDSIQSKVYNVYTPEVYKRRENDGGLIDRNNIKVMVDSFGNMYISNETRTNPVIYKGRYGKAFTSKNAGGLLTPIIASGSGYDYQNPTKAYTQPRNFIADTKLNLANKNTIKRTLSKGMKARGFKVK